MPLPALRPAGGGQISRISGLRHSEHVAGVRYEFTAELWRWASRADVWAFVRLPDEASDEIRDMPRLRAGFGAVKVLATLGGSRWSTSIFPESAQGAYVLSVKKAVRAAEGVDIGDVVRVGIETLE